LKAYLDTFNETQMLNYGKDICHDLTGMVVICQAIDHCTLAYIAKSNKSYNPTQRQQTPFRRPSIEINPA
jgi:hypothetical protein